MFYLAVRLLYLQDINAALAQARRLSLGDPARANVTFYLITYIIWVFSFKLGMLLVFIGGAFRPEWNLAVCGFLLSEELYI